MELLPLWIVLGVLGAIVLAILLFGVVPTFIIAAIQFKKQLVRKDKNTWTRSCSWTQNAEQVEMFERGEKWAEEFEKYKQDVDIVNDGFHLYGEYFDIGSKRAVIIIPGRTEGCHYSHYFARPYSDSNYNILVIDNRAHGLSDGKYNCLGQKEYRDVLAWGKMLHEKFGVEEIVIHGICIGSSTAIETLTCGSCPDYFKAMIADGMYKNFYEVFKTHMVELKKPIFPVLQEVMILVRLFCGVRPKARGPYKCVDKLDKPILMLHSKEDKYALPPEAQKLYDAIKSSKRLVWFDHGAHSHIRINDENKYDNSIKQFLAEMQAGEL